MAHTLNSIRPGAGWSHRTSTFKNRRTLGALTLNGLLVASKVESSNGRQALELHVALLEVLRPYSKLQPQDGRLETLASGDYRVRPTQEVRISVFSVDEPAQLRRRF